MLIIGAALFINGHPIYKWTPHLSADSWCSTVYKRCKLINGTQHIYFVLDCGIMVCKVENNSTESCAENIYSDDQQNIPISSSSRNFAEHLIPLTLYNIFFVKWRLVYDKHNHHAINYYHRHHYQACRYLKKHQTASKIQVLMSARVGESIWRQLRRKQPFSSIVLDVHISSCINQEVYAFQIIVGYRIDQWCFNDSARIVHSSSSFYQSCDTGVMAASSSKDQSFINRFQFLFFRGFRLVINFIHRSS